jgi:hypothetical protein
VSLTTDFKDVLSLSVPAGTYVFVATARVTSDSANPTNVLCYLFKGNFGIPNAGVNLAAPPNRKMVSLNWALTIGAADTVSLECEIGPPPSTSGAALVDEASLIGIKVDTVTQQ